MNKKERAIRLTIAAFMIVFGLISFSQAGFFVMRYLIIEQPFEPREVSAFVSSVWRFYWMFFGAFLIQLPLKTIIKRTTLSVFIVISIATCVMTFYMYY